MTNLEIVASKIVRQLIKDTAPSGCTWGLEYEEARDALFCDYQEDMIESVKKVLEQELRSNEG